MLSLSSIQLWVIAAAAIIVIVLLFRLMNKVSILSLLKKNFFYFFLFLFVAIFIISAINIHSNYSFDFKTLDGWKGLFKVYLGWFGHVVGNLAKITGYAIRQDWIVKGNSSG